MAEYLVIATSLHSESNSRLMAAELARVLTASGAETEFLDLRAHPLPFCDGQSCYGDPNVAILSGKVRAARVIFVATPVYNFDVNSAAKNLLELTGGAWENKIVGFLCAAGGALSYMSILGFANSLMLDFRCIILPRFVYGVEKDFSGDKITSSTVVERIAELAKAARQLQNTPLA